jgi:hypothetical protein
MTAHAVAKINDKGTLGWCTCNQGFGGARVAERLAEHIANPDPNSLGALLAAATK